MRVASLAADHPDLALGTWVSTSVVQDALGGGIEVVGALWAAVVGYAALRTARQQPVSGWSPPPPLPRAAPAPRRRRAGRSGRRRSRAAAAGRGGAAPGGRSRCRRPTLTRATGARTAAISSSSRLALPWCGVLTTSNPVAAAASSGSRRTRRSRSWAASRSTSPRRRTSRPPTRAASTTLALLGTEPAAMRRHGPHTRASTSPRTTRSPARRTTTGAPAPRCDPLDLLGALLGLGHRRDQHLADVAAANGAGEPVDVVGVEVGEHDGVERRDPEPVQAGVDETRDRVRCRRGPHARGRCAGRRRRPGRRRRRRPATRRGAR